MLTLVTLGQLLPNLLVLNVFAGLDAGPRPHLREAVLAGAGVLPVHEQVEVRRLRVPTWRSGRVFSTTIQSPHSLSSTKDK